MKRVALGLAVLALLALATSTASAAGPHGSSSHVTLVAHGGWGSPHHGHHGPSWGHRYGHYPHPPVYRYPIVVPVPVPPPAPYHVYRYYRPPYYPGGVFSYRGSGFGISIGF